MSLFDSAKPRNSSSGVFENATGLRRSRGPATARAVILTICAFVATAILFATTTPLREVARADGEIVPIGRLVQIQAAVAGSVDAVEIDEGTTVAEGDVLARLRSPDLHARIAEKSARLETLTIRLAALTTLTTGKEPVWPNTPDPHGLRSQAEAFIASHRTLEEARRATHQQFLENSDETIALLKHARTIDLARVDEFSKQIDSLEALLEDGHASRFRLHEARNRLGLLQGELAEADTALGQALAERSHAEMAWREAVLERQDAFLSEAYDLNQEHQQISVELAQLIEQSEQLTIRAPADGLIQSVTFPASGEVVAAGATLFELLPTNAPLIAEIRLAPADIGHVTVGSAADLKIKTFDFRKYGGVTGQIVSISPGRLEDPDGTEYFRARVALNSMLIGKGALERQLRPGMDVAAEISTDSRTVAQYLIKPVDTALQAALIER